MPIAIAVAGFGCTIAPVSVRPAQRPARCAEVRHSAVPATASIKTPDGQAEPATPPAAHQPAPPHDAVPGGRPPQRGPDQGAPQGAPRLLWRPVRMRPDRVPQLTASPITDAGRRHPAVHRSAHVDSRRSARGERSPSEHASLALPRRSWPSRRCTASSAAVSRGCRPRPVATSRRRSMRRSRGARHPAARRARRGARGRLADALAAAASAHARRPAGPARRSRQRIGKPHRMLAATQTMRRVRHLLDVRGLVLHVACGNGPT